MSSATLDSRTMETNASANNVRRKLKSLLLFVSLRHLRNRHETVLSTQNTLDVTNAKGAQCRFLFLLLNLYKKVCVKTGGEPVRAERAVPSQPALGLHISGVVECITFQLCDGNRGVLKIIQQHLDLCHDIM